MSRGRSKIRQGEVISDKMNKTVVVRVTRSFRHPLYGKLVKKWKKYYAHDEENNCKEGQLVKIRETRPLSKLKRWKVIEAVSKK